MPSPVPASHASPSETSPLSVSNPKETASRTKTRRQKLLALQAEIDRIEREQPASFVSSAAFRGRAFSPLAPLPGESGGERGGRRPRAASGELRRRG